MNTRFTFFGMGCLVIALALSGLTACSERIATPKVVQTTRNEQPVTMTGEVRTDNTVIKQGALTVVDHNGQTVASADWTDKFSVTIPAGTTFPVVLVAQPAANSITQQVLRLVLVNPRTTAHVISPLSTAIAAKAQDLGGYSPENLTAASMSSMTPHIDNGGPHGESTGRYGGWH